MATKRKKSAEDRIDGIISEVLNEQKSKKKSTKFKCPECGKRKNTQLMLDKHVQRRHLGGSRRKKDQPVVKHDDSKVARVQSMRRDKGWSTRYIYEGITVKVDETRAGKKIGTLVIPWRKEVARIQISPKGNEYVEAEPWEKADLIYAGQPAHWRCLKKKCRFATAQQAKAEAHRKDKKHALERIPPGIIDVDKRFIRFEKSVVYKKLQYAKEDQKRQHRADRERDKVKRRQKKDKQKQKKQKAA